MQNIDLFRDFPKLFRVGILWTNHDDAQGMLNALKADGFDVLEYGTMTLLDKNGDVNNYLVVFKCIGKKWLYESFKESISEVSNEIQYLGNSFLIPKGVEA